MRFARFAFIAAGMIPAIVEKLGHVAGVAVLYGNARISMIDAQAAIPDFLLAILFIVAVMRARNTP